MFPSPTLRRAGPAAAPSPSQPPRPREQPAPPHGLVVVNPVSPKTDLDRLRQVLHDYFAWATTTTMARYHRSADDVPDGLRIPHWSWDGLVADADAEAG